MRHELSYKPNQDNCQLSSQIFFLEKRSLNPEVGMEDFEEGIINKNTLIDYHMSYNYIFSDFFLLSIRLKFEQVV